MTSKTGIRTASGLLLDRKLTVPSSATRRTPQRFSSQCGKSRSKHPTSTLQIQPSTGHLQADSRRAHRLRKHSGDSGHLRGEDHRL